MIGLDTNVLIRYLTQDDKKQATRANKLIDNELNSSNPGFITLISLVEIVWVLESCYSQTRKEVIEVLHSLLTTKQLVIEGADMAYLALKRYAVGNADYSDALITVISENQGCSSVVTFDKKGNSIGMKVL
ncbi:MAG: type II toxin-antitoxin system VapC family toxin [Gammaproteobacteria bacterium]|nr:type II toxin-antitoxin system VapC family toxin [Gammaproteobacteria bacterium]